MLLQLGSIVPELWEIAPQGQIVEGQLYLSVGVAAEPRRGDLLGGEAAADLVPPLEYADTHIGIFDQVHSKK